LDQGLEWLWDRVVAQPWEFTAVVVAVVGLALVIFQLRALKKQMTLEATLCLLAEYRTTMLKDRITFRSEHAHQIKQMLQWNPKLRLVDLPAEMKEVAVRLSHFHDELGLLIQRGLVDEDTLLSYLGDAAIDYFLDLRPLILNEREARAPHSRTYQEYFEDMVVRMAEHPPTGRRKTRRLTSQLIESLMGRRVRRS